MTATQIIPSMTIDEIFAHFPQRAQKLAQILSKNGLQCVGCSASTWETLESGVLKHGKNAQDLEILLGLLNACLQEPMDVSTVTVTPKAVQKFKEIAELEGKAGSALRFDEQAAGCSGFEYILDFSKSAEADDAVFHSNGLEIHINKFSLPNLIGAEIDYTDGLQAGFNISNPNARSSCGCGTSHGYN